MDNKSTSKEWYKKPIVISAIIFVILFFLWGASQLLITALAAAGCGGIAWVRENEMKKNIRERKWYKTTSILVLGLLFSLMIITNIFAVLGRVSERGDRFYFIFLGTIYITGFIAFCSALSDVITFKRKQNASSESDIETENLDTILNNFLKNLGDSPDHREKNINRLFDANATTLSIGGRLDFTDYNSNNVSFPAFVQFKISRNMAAMESRERESLRSVMLLYNNGIIGYNDLKYFFFSFVNGNGKANINSYNYNIRSNDSGVKDGPSAIRYYQEQWDASVDSAINKLLEILDRSEHNGQNKNIQKIKQKFINGDKGFLNEDEVERTVYNGGGDYQLSLGHLDENGATLNYSGEGSLITIAPPGSGKTQCFVIPNMLNWKGAAVVLDIKGEIYTATHKWREKNVGKVYKFSPLDPNNSNSYNPLTFVCDEPDYVWEDSRFLADMMIVPSGASDPFWENMARDVLTAAIAHVTFNNEPDDRAMSKVLDIIYGIGWDEMITSLKTNVLVSSMRRMGSALEEMEKKQRDSVLKTAQSSLSAWQGERIAKVTNKSDWNPLDLRNGTPTIYICINPNEIESYLSVIRVFIAQHIRMLTTELPQRGAAPVLFMLDELPRLKKMPPVDEALNIGRQYGIKLWMFAQSYGQLKDAYSDPEGLIGSCVVRTFMNLPLNDEYTTKISDQLGYRHDALGNTKEKLVEPIELAGPNYRDYILVMATGTKPAKVKKKFAYEDEEIKAKMN